MDNSVIKPLGSTSRLIEKYKDLTDAPVNAGAWKRAAEEVRQIFASEINPALKRGPSESQTAASFYTMKSLSKEQRIKVMFELLSIVDVQNLLTAPQKAVILANALAESQFDFTASENTPAFVIQTPKILDSPSLGLFQHRGSRCINLLQFNLRNAGPDASVLDILNPMSTIKYLYSEVFGLLEDKYEHNFLKSNKVKDSLRPVLNLSSYEFFGSTNRNNLRALNAIFVHKFERPLERNSHNLRFPLAESILNVIKVL